MKKRKPTDDDLRAIFVTSETAIFDYERVERLGFVSAEAVDGIGFIKEMFTSVTDFMGGRSRTSQNVLRKSRIKVVTDLRKMAYELGGNAIVGIDIDYSEVSGAGKSMLLIVATGTVVKLEGRRAITQPAATPSPEAASIVSPPSVTETPSHFPVPEFNESSNNPKRELDYCPVTGRPLK